MPDRPDAPRDNNLSQILRDVADRQSLRGRGEEIRAGEAPRGPAVPGRFDVIPAQAVVEDRKIGKPAAAQAKANKESKSAPSAVSVRVTADNYQKHYLAQRAKQAAELAQKKNEPPKHTDKEIADKAFAAREKANKDAQEKKIADDYRFRARELQNQIVWWQQQINGGSCDQDTAKASIEALKYALNGIPQSYH